jgi:ATP-dependent helicase/nuclease subunit B
VQIQLPAYLAAVLRVADGAALGVNGSLAPAGLCYVNLRGQFDRGQDRQESLGDEATRRALGYQHEARLNFDALCWLDAAARSGGKTGQFGFRLTKTGAPYANDATLKSATEIQALLGGVERTLRELGREIYEGKAGVEPYRKGGQKACDHCDYRAICRFDPWTQTYRMLTKGGAADEPDDR